MSGQPGLRSVPTLPGLAVYEGHLQGQLHTLREGIREFSDIIFYVLSDWITDAIYYVALAICMLQKIWRHILLRLSGLN